MSADDKPPEGLSLRRWSQRKLAAVRAKHAAATPANPVAAPATVAASAPATSANPVAAPATVASSAPVDVAQPAPAPISATTLPPVESLTIDSDFTPFFQPKVGEALKRQALKQLFRDPQFNVMDGLDVYVGDYSIPDPISPDIVKQMVQGRYIFDPPATRINAQGHVEDVPPEEAAPGVPADPVADAPTGPALPSTPEAEAAPALLEPSTAEAGSAPLPVAPPTVQAAAPGTGPLAPADCAVGAKPAPEPGMREPPPR